VLDSLIMLFQVLMLYRLYKDYKKKKHKWLANKGFGRSRLWYICVHYHNIHLHGMTETIKCQVNTLYEWDYIWAPPQ